MSAVSRFWHPVLRARALGREPAQVMLDGERYALWRGVDGKIGALVDRCPHRFAPLSGGHVRSDGRLVCPYHGWRFDQAGRGESPSQPELRRCDAQAMQAVERDGVIWLAGQEVPMERLPRLGAPGYEAGGVMFQRFAAPLHVVLDNFSEDEHTPWVHTRLGWREEDVGTIGFEAENFPDRTEVRYEARQRPSALGGFFGIKKGDHFHNRWTTLFDPVRSIYEIHWTDASGAVTRPGRLLAPIFMVPLDAGSTMMVVFMFVRLEGALRRLGSLARRAALMLIQREIRDDARFVPALAETPMTMQGMRLGRFDKPLIHNRRLLARIYRGVEE